jgi:serine/threonine protein kinase/WD40 repeat protein
MADETKTAALNAGDITTQAGREKHGASPSPVPPSAAIVPGSRLLDLYDVAPGKPAEGGFGIVYKVRHSAWNVDLAVKQPKSGVFKTPKQKEDFVRECETWINLGLHPHIVSCYYVREIGGIPSIFSEWMEGGSLKDWIKSGRLYAGAEEEVQKRILDIAVQFARGLNYAQGRGLVHRDVKPGNLLMTPEGTAKVADFGLANVVSGAADGAEPGGDGGAMRTAGAVSYTPDYASPEQAAGGKLSGGTDIWSWGVSVLEMYCGERRWSSTKEIAGGPIAGKQCEYYFPLAKHPVPEGVKEVLRGCFKSDVQERTDNFAELEMYLLAIYEETFGEAYPREYQAAASDTAGSLNNRALSFIDLGKAGEAEKCWEEALKTDPSHGESVFNYALYKWENGDISDIDAVNLISLINNPELFLTKLHIMRGDAEKARNNLNLFEKKHGESKETGALSSAINGNDGENLTAIKEIDIKRKIDKIDKIDKNARNLFIKENIDFVRIGKDKTLMAICFSNGGIIIYNIYTDSIENVYINENSGPYSRIIDVRFNDSGEKIIIVFAYSKVILYDIKNTEIEKCFAIYKGAVDVSLIDFIDNDKIITCCSTNESTGEIAAWNINTGEEIFHWGLGGFDKRKYPLIKEKCLLIKEKNLLIRMAVNDLSYKADDHNKEELVYKLNTDIAVWDIKERKRKYAITVDADDIIYCPENGLLLIIWRNNIRYLNLDNETITKGKDIYADGYKYTAVPYRGDYCIIGAKNKVLLWNYKTNNKLITIDKTVEICGFLDNGKEIFYVEDNKIKICRININKIKYTELSILSKTEELIEKENIRQIKINKIAGLINNGDIAHALELFVELDTDDDMANSDMYNLYALLIKYCKINYSGIKASSAILQDNRYNDFCFLLYDTGSVILKEDIVLSPGSELIEIIDLNNRNAVRKIYGKDKHTLYMDPYAGGGYNLDEVYTNMGNFLCFHPDGKCFLLYRNNFDDYGNIRTDLLIFQRGIPQIRNRIILKGTALSSAYLSRDGKYILTEEYSEGKEKYNEVRERYNKSPEENSKIKLQYDKVCFYSINIDGFSGQPVASYNIKPRKDLLKRAGFSNDNKKIFILKDYYKIEIYNIFTNELISEINDRNDRIKWFSVSPDDKCLLTGGDEKNKIYNLRTGECILIFESVNGKIEYGYDNLHAAQLNVSANVSKLFIYKFKFGLTFPGWQDWDEGARPYLEIFKTLHPQWTEDDFNSILIPDLQNRGYGWLRPEGLRKKLEEMP